MTSAEAIDAYAAAPQARHGLGKAAARWGGQLGMAATWLRLVRLRLVRRRLDTPAHAATRLGAQRARKRSALQSGMG